MSDDNTTKRARASLSEDGDHNKEKISELLATLDQLETKGAEFNAQQKQLNADVEQNSIARAEAFEALKAEIPANPLGVMTLEAS